MPDFCINGQDTHILPMVVWQVQSLGSVPGSSAARKSAASCVEGPPTIRSGTPPKMNQCHTKRDHFKRKVVNPTTNFQVICYFLGGVLLEGILHQLRWKLNPNCFIDFMHSYLNWCKKFLMYIHSRFPQIWRVFGRCRVLLRTQENTHTENLNP